MGATWTTSLIPKFCRTIRNCHKEQISCTCYVGWPLSSFTQYKLHFSSWWGLLPVHVCLEPNCMAHIWRRRQDINYYVTTLAVSQAKFIIQGSVHNPKKSILPLQFTWPRSSIHTRAPNVPCHLPWTCGPSAHPVTPKLWEITSKCT